MRKYQQLSLLLVSVISVTILLMYKNQNRRLLEVVNYFGKNDITAILPIENNTQILRSIYEFEKPLPMWQRLGTEFHAYSSFWHKSKLSAGGEILTVVIGLEHAFVNFKCQIHYSDGSISSGKFRFIRVEIAGRPKFAKENYFIYKFLCKVTRDFGHPTNVVFTDMKVQIDHFVPVRNIENRLTKEKLLMAVCLDLNIYNQTAGDTFMNNTNILQFFLHHKIIGVEEFIVYNSNAIDAHLNRILNQFSIKTNILPYNFPFDLTDKIKNHVLLEIDCILRTAGSANFIVLSSLNEYFIPNGNMKPANLLIKHLNDFSTENNRFEITTRSVCLNENNKILLDNNLYDNEEKNDHTFFIYKPEYKLETFNTLEVDSSLALVHRFVNCSNKTHLNDLRENTNSEILRFMKTIEKEVRTIL